MEFNVNALMETALAEMKNNQHREAAKHFDMVVVSDPSNIDAPFFRAYCNCFDIKLGEMSNAALMFTNAFCLYVDRVKALNDPAAEKEKLDYAVILLSTLISMYQSNSKRTMLTAPSIGFTISNAANKMNTTCRNKLSAVGANISEGVLAANERLGKSNVGTGGLMGALVAIGVVLFVVFMLWGVAF